MTKSSRGDATSRRRILLTGTSTALAAPMIIGGARAAQKTLRILQWNHFVPGFDEWFNTKFVTEWGEQNDTQVIVDNAA